MGQKYPPWFIEFKNEDLIPIKISIMFFCRNRKEIHPKIHMKFQEIPKSQINLEGNKVGGLTLISKLTIKFQYQTVELA